MRQRFDRLRTPAHASGFEPRVDETAVNSMLVAVHLYERLHRHIALRFGWASYGQRGHWRVREHVGPAFDVENVRVACHGPERVTIVELDSMDWRLLAQPRCDR